MSVSRSFAFRYPPLIPCLARLYIVCVSTWGGLGDGRDSPHQRRDFAVAGSPVTTLLHKETFGSPKFPGYPCDYMPWSQTPVVSWSLAIARSELLPSVICRTSAFTLGLTRAIQNHNVQDFGAQFHSLQSRSIRLRTPPLPGLPADFTTDLLAKLWSGKTFPVYTESTYWVTLPNFMNFVQSRRSGFNLARTDFLPVSKPSTTTIDIQIS